MMRLFPLLIMMASFLAAQQPQTQTAPIFKANAKYVNGVAPGYAPTAGSGLTLNLGKGTANCGGTVVTYAGGTLTMTASTTNYIYLDTSSSCAPAVKTTTFTGSDIPIAAVVAGSSAISSIMDDRTMFTLPGGGTLPDIVTPGSCGDATHSPTVTWDAKGRMTGCTDNAISGGGGGGSTPTFGTADPNGTNTPALVQSRAGNLTFTSSVTAGNLLLIGIADNGTVPSGVTDTLGTTYSLVSSTALSGLDVSLWAGIATGSGSDTLAITGGSWNTYTIHEFSGATASLDGSAVAGSSMAPSLVTNLNDDLAVSVAGDSWGGATITTSTGGWTAISATGGLTDAAGAYAVAATPGTYGPTWSGCAGTCGALLVAFKAASSPVSGSEGSQYYQTVGGVTHLWVYHSGIWRQIS